MKIKTLLFISIIATSAVWYGSFASNELINGDTSEEKNTIEQVNKFIGSSVDKFISDGINNIGVEENTPTPPLVASAREQIGVTVSYDPAYVSLDFPMGDVPMDRGVCTDVVVRAYRNQAIDLQELINTDMKKSWQAYPKIWGLSKPDSNIDHRRVPNVRVFFTRHGKKLAVTDNANDYKAGDIVTWKISGRPHIGIVSNRSKNGVPLIVHNIGVGTQENDVLFRFEITGHYRY